MQVENMVHSIVIQVHLNMCLFVMYLRINELSCQYIAKEFVGSSDTTCFVFGKI